VTEEAVGAALEKARRSVRASERMLADGDWDFAVSRAYYAMFYAAEALLLADGQTYSKHQAVISAFGRDYANAGRVPVDLHRQLIEAFNLRGVADYRFGQPVEEESARAVVRNAGAFVEEIGLVLAGSR
jgi:uncharacterized protein (UPF0332 family)